MFGTSSSARRTIFLSSADTSSRSSALRSARFLHFAAATAAADPCSARSPGSAARCCLPRRLLRRRLAPRRRSRARITRSRGARPAPPARPAGGGTFVSVAMPKMSASRASVHCGARFPLIRISAGNVLSSDGSYAVRFGAAALKPVKPTTREEPLAPLAIVLALERDQRVAVFGPRHALVERLVGFERRDRAASACRGSGCRCRSGRRRRSRARDSGRSC